MTCRIAFPLAALVLLAACGAEDPASQLTSSPQFSANQPTGLSATGSGQMTGPPVGGGEVGWRTFSFNAIQRSDGSATGHLEYNVHDQNDPQITHKVQASVICMADLGGGRVFIGAESVRRTPNDAPPSPLPGLPAAVAGDDGIFVVVIDNGEGAGAPADQITAAAHTRTAVVTNLCAAGTQNPLLPLLGLFVNDVEAGNVQVHGSE